MARFKRYKSLNTYPKKRWSMLRNMTASLFLHERIVTTNAKALALTKAARDIFAKAMKFSHYNRDHVKGLLRVKDANYKLYTDLVRRFRLSNGNFLKKSTLPIRRTGDCATLVSVELIEK